MQNVSTQVARPLRTRTAVILTLLGLAAAAVAIEAPVLLAGSAPASHRPATSTSVTSVTSVQSAGSSLATQNRSEEGLGNPIPAAADQSGDPKSVRRGPF
jgi:hypothetical protein